MDLSTGRYWDVSWSPIRGCSHISPGCEHCWAENMAGRYCKPGFPFHGFATSNPRRWTGRVKLIQSELTKPLHWRKPRIVALNWMGDLFHEKVPDEAIDRVFAVMALCPQHRFLLLTKRAKRMRSYVDTSAHIRVNQNIKAIHDSPRSLLPVGRLFRSYCFLWPLRNVAVGVSCEDRAHLDRIDNLRQTPAALRWVSFEPLLEDPGTINLAGVGWVVVGGESGPGARPMPPEWPRKIRDQCVAASVSYFHKQNGEWYTVPTEIVTIRTRYQDVPVGDGTHHRMFPVGKKAAGRLLDGRTWDELPAWLSSHGKQFAKG